MAFGRGLSGGGGVICSRGGLVFCFLPVKALARFSQFCLFVMEILGCFYKVPSQRAPPSVITVKYSL